MNPSRVLRGGTVRKAAQLLRKLSGGDSGTRRIDLASAFFLGLPYSENPLGGGPAEKEVLSISLDGFDCVTYIETVLALAAAKDVKQFADEIRWTRYRKGAVDWFERNHYMTDWARINARRGAIVDLTRGASAVTRTRALGVVAGIPRRIASFRCFPKRSFSKVRRRIKTGDVILFVSTKRRLDVFHAGILIERENEVWLRHATRSAGVVTEQSLREFLKSNRMSGFILLRPKCQH